MKTAIWIRSDIAWWERCTSIIFLLDLKQNEFVENSISYRFHLEFSIQHCYGCPLTFIKISRLEKIFIRLTWYWAMNIEKLNYVTEIEQSFRANFECHFFQIILLPMRKLAEYVEFKNDCATLLNYVTKFLFLKHRSC